MSLIRRQFVDTDYGQMHIRRAGKPSSTQRPLICLHQSPKSSREFIRFMTEAASDRLVIAIDSPGHGESDLPPSQESATIEFYAKMIWQVIGALGLGGNNASKVDLLGHHTGAKVATEMAFQKPDSVAGIVMVSALVLSVEEREAFKDMFTPIPLDEDGTRFKHMWAQSLKYRGPNVSLELLAQSMAENQRAGEAYEWGHQAAFAYNEYFPERVASLPHRITVLNPADMLFDYTPRVGKILQNGEVIDHPEWGSMFMDTDTLRAVAAVKSALK